MIKDQSIFYKHGTKIITNAYAHVGNTCGNWHDYAAHKYRSLPIQLLMLQTAKPYLTNFIIQGKFPISSYQTSLVIIKGPIQKNTAIKGQDKKENGPAFHRKNYKERKGNPTDISTAF